MSESSIQPIHSETKQVTVFMNESLNHWLTWFIQTPDSFRNKASDCLYERVTESLTHLIHSNAWFIQKQSKWQSLWMSHWIIDSLNSIKRLIHSETKQVTVFMNESLNHWLTWFIQTPDSFRNKASDCLYEWVTESLTHLIQSNAWFIQKQSKWLSLWMSHCFTQAWVCLFPTGTGGAERGSGESQPAANTERFALSETTGEYSLIMMQESIKHHPLIFISYGIV